MGFGNDNRTHHSSTKRVSIAIVLERFSGPVSADILHPVS